jgi:hypothetical protein
MSESDAAKIEAVERLWSLCRQTCQRRGIDIKRAISGWVEEEIVRLPSPGPRSDFAELCDAGCKREPLAVVVVLLELSPIAERLWDTEIGGTYRREKSVKHLEDAAVALERLFGSLTRAEREKLNTGLNKMGEIPPTELASQLRRYARFISLAESFAEDTGVRSLREIGRYLLISYVLRATGTYHDRGVASLFSWGSGINCDEVTQRMWRHRNYDRLQANFSKLADFLYDLGEVVSAAT